MNVRQIFLIIMFALAIISIIKEPVIRLGKRRFQLDYGNAPLMAVIILGLFGYLNFGIVSESLAGINGIVPWQVILIFFVGAYICISIDSTGVLEYASFKIIKMSGGYSQNLYWGIVALTAFLTVFTSNDIVILTMTPILCYIAKHSKINPVPYLLAVFFSANAWSMFFYIGNPPNIIVAQAFNLSFIEYAKLMVLPTLAAGLSTTVIIYIVFRKQLRGKINLESQIEPGKYIRNKWAAIINVSVFMLFFILLSMGEYIGFEVWQIVSIFFVIYLMLNISFSFYYERTRYSSDDYHYEKTWESMKARNLNFNITEFRMSFERVPWKMLPLITSIFILIHLFDVYNVTRWLAQFLNCFNTIAAGSITIPFISAIGANIMINQPMTILFANAFHNHCYNVDGVAELTNGLALVIGTNLGGNMTLFGALAGLMWKKILSFNDIQMSYKDFFIHSLKVTPLVIMITSIMLLIQMTFLVR